MSIYMYIFIVQRLSNPSVTDELYIPIPKLTYYHYFVAAYPRMFLCGDTPFHSVRPLFVAHPALRPVSGPTKIR
jgi:hypothetical protein